MRTLTYTSDRTATLQDYLRQVEGYSATIIRRLKLNPEHISVNNQHARMVDLVKPGDEIRVVLADSVNNIKPNYNIHAPVVFEDEDIIIFDKPSNMPVHPSIRHKDDTLANVFSAYCAKNNICTQFRPINRLDRDTSGLCAVAKTTLAAFSLSKSLKKEYTAICEGVLETDIGTIDAPIARAGESIILRKVDDNGVRAITHYNVISRADDRTTVRINLETGRTHQIRVHFSYINHPLLGDMLYGGNTKKINRQALHCSRLTFIHPVNKKLVDLSSLLPDDMKFLK